MLPHIRLQDIADIVIISALVYQLYRWFRNTRALQVVIGLLAIGGFYVITKAVGLFMTSWILQELGTVLFILIIVVFQNEIRQALYRVTLLRHAFGRQENSAVQDYRLLADIMFSFARDRTGALLVLQRREDISEHLLHGVSIDSLVSKELLGSIFFEGTPLHDGAVLIQGDRVVTASCHLPLAVQSELPPGCGTRHRAALGLSERSDAVVIVVSEERGTVSLAVGQELTPVDSPDKLEERLNLLLKPETESEPGKVGLYKHVFTDLKAKVVVLLLVIISWLLLTMKQGEIVTVTAPVRYRNLPDRLVLQKSSADELEVQLKVISSLIPSPKQLDITADIDLSRLHEGVNQIPLHGENFKLPLGVVVSQISPANLKLVAAVKAKKQVPVRVLLKGEGRGTLFKVEPETVTIEGPEAQVAKIKEVRVEDISHGKVRTPVVIERTIISPAPQVKIIGDGAVKVHLLRR